MTDPSETRAGISRRTVLRGAAVAGAAAAGRACSWSSRTCRGRWR
jgi:TAT (twin-arginine translocation) pathway signal sequence